MNRALLRVPAMLAALAAVLLAAAPAKGAVRDLRAFGRIPVLEEGRVMPLGTFARMALGTMSGRSSAAGLDATTWFARALFAPKDAAADPVFLIGHAETADALRLGEGRPRRRVAWRDLEPSLDRLQELEAGLHGRPERDQLPAERDLLRLASALRLYTAIQQGRQPSVLPEKPGAESWIPLSDLPPRPAPDAAPSADSALTGARAAWERMMAAYETGDQAAFDTAAVQARALAEERMRAPREAARVGTENLMNRLRPFDAALAACALALVLAFFGTIGTGDRLRRIASVLLVLGFVLMTFGLAMRTWIMARPPVTNLYSTFVFVAWTCAILGLAVEGRRRGGHGLLAGAVSGALLLFIAGRYEVGADPMRKVVAVLDSNLWLTVHVLTIAMGFAGCLMAGAAGHVHLIRRLRFGEAAAAASARSVRGLLGFGLVLTFIGTTLGGVWADQSWGRFWGWDPKENGALLILLWVSALLHARPNGLICDMGLAAGAVIGNVVVAVAWLGVNLLNVGLHTYGWTSGAALGLAIFAAVEIGFVGAMLAAIMLRRGGPPGGGASAA